MKFVKKLSIAVMSMIAVAGLVLLGINTYAKKQMEKIPSMTAQECLEYTLAENEDAMITIGTIKDGSESWCVYGEGARTLPAELHTYEIGSLTKTLTAAMLAQAVGEGAANLNDTIDCYIELPFGNSYPTLEDILTHTAGYKPHYFESPMVRNFFGGRNSFCGVTDEMVFDRLGKLDQNQDAYPWKYSNFGYATLGLVLESIYEREYTDLANDFLRNMGMRRSHISDGAGDLGKYWDWNAGDAYLSAGAVVSDIEDMLLYAEYQLKQEGVFGDTHTELKKVDATPAQYVLLDMRVDSMGMAWIIDTENGFIWHNGATGNYNCYLGFCRMTQTAVVVLSNLSPNYRIPATVIGIKLLKELQ